MKKSKRLIAKARSKAPPRARPIARKPRSEQALHFDKAFEALNEGFYEWSIKDGSTYYSDRVLSAVGLSRKQLKTAADWHKRIHPEDRPAYDAALTAHFKRRTDRFEADFRFRSSDGSWRWARQHGVAIRDARGRAVRMIGSTGDITEWKRTEQALRESQQRYELATSAALEGIYEWDLATNALTQSDRLRQFFAMPEGPLTPAAWNERVHPEDFPRYRQATIDCFKGKTPRLEFEYRLRHPVRGWFWVLDHGVAVRDASGRAIKLVGALSDIDQRKRAEIELRRARDEATAALEHQTATAEILKVIASSPADVRPVFEIIAERAVTLCQGQIALVSRLHGDRLELAAITGITREGVEALSGAYPMRLDAETLTARAYRNRSIMHDEDVLADPLYQQKHTAQIAGWRAGLSVPLMRGDEVIGVIFVGRPVPGAFDDSQIELLKTFADQAVIAIENVRLFNETKEALERQTATADVLASISASMTNTQPVFDRIVQNIRRLFGTRFSVLQLLHGDMVDMAAVDGDPGFEKLRSYYPRKLDDTTGGGLAMLSREVVQIAPVIDNPATPAATQEFAREFGFNSTIFAPMLHEGRVIGAIGAAHPGVRLFDEREAALLTTFANQAVIAIENVRLFNETREALERQTATAEILKVIASSPSDVQPVFDAIARAATRLVGGFSTVVARLAGDVFELAALTSTSNAGDEAVRKAFPLPLRSASHLAAAIRDKTPRWVVDIETDADTPVKSTARLRGWRSAIATPMLRGAEAIGVINVTRVTAGAFSDHEIGLLRTFADQAVIAIENVRLFNETKEALERQTAISEILRVISSSPGDVQPVLQAVAERAARICEAQFCDIILAEGSVMRVGAAVGNLGRPIGEAIQLDRGTVMGRSIVDRTPVHIADLQSAGDEFPLGQQLAMKYGHRTILAVPLVRENHALGTILVRRTEVRPIEDKHIALLQTFADQAAIAIENARLFNETREALERQTATAEVLRAISTSPTDTQPVFEAILERAAKLCGAENGILFRYFDDAFHALATRIPNPAFAELFKEPRRPPPDSKNGLARLRRQKRTVHIPDMLDDEATREGDALRLETIKGGMRSWLGVPLLKDGELTGAIVIYRSEPLPFTPAQVALLETFAEQAVIAIENVRLFNETREALERQTATAEILRVISASPTDVRPVLDAVASSAARLCEARDVTVALKDGDQLRYMAHQGEIPTGAPVGQTKTIGKDWTAGRAVLEARQIHIPDILAEAGDMGEGARMGKQAGYRTVFATPLLRHGAVIGVIVMRRTEVRPFEPRQIELVNTFADQAVIAIENVRLFNETKEALERQTATAEILKVISSSPTDVEPVFVAIIRKAVQLSGANRGALYSFDGDVLRLAAHHNQSAEALQALNRVYPMKPSRAQISGRAILGRDVVEMPDVKNDPEYLPGMAAQADLGSLLAVPMLRGDGTPSGVIVIQRSETGSFESRHVDLVKTFADQAVIAIENVRLFNETKDALERQTATSEVLRVISGSFTDTQPVFDIIAERAARLTGAAIGWVFTYDGEWIRPASWYGLNREAIEAARKRFPMGPGGGSYTARAIRDRAIVNVADALAETDPEYQTKSVAASAGYRSVLSVPMFREQQVVGAVVVNRAEAARFSEKEVELLKTFADQAVIAIENVRLFNETKEALERQTATAEILKVMAASPADVQPVFDAIVASLAHLFGRKAALRTLEPEGLRRRARSYDPDGEFHGPDVEPLDRSSIVGQAVLERRALQWADTLVEGAASYGLERAQRLSFRSIASAPLMLAGRAIGVISVSSPVPGALSEKQISLLATFADQAVIAIENVRLFNETKEALERQTATAEILKVISSSPTDVQPVFDAIVDSCARLFDGLDVGLQIVKGDVFDRVAVSNRGRASEGSSMFPMPLDRWSIAGRCMVDGELLQFEDLAGVDWLREPARRHFERRGFRSALCAPMSRDGKPVGAILVFRGVTGRFKAEEVALLRTFADQAVIAIENVRLFKELRQRTDALSKSVQQLTALGEVGQAISSTLDLEKVLKTIVTHALKLTGLDGGSIYEYDEQSEEFRLQASENFEPELVETIRRVPIRKGDGTVGGTAITKEPMQVPDILDRSYQSTRKELLVGAGYRAVLTVPLLREDRIIGALSVTRKAPGAFAPEVVELLKTFATQSAMAIQNARLFREIAEKGRQLEEASKHKSQFLASMSHELRTPLNAILGFNEMLLGEVYGEVPADMKEPLTDIQSSGKHLLRLINNVLDLAKIEAGRMELALGDYSVHDTVESVRSTLRPLAEAKGLDLVVDVPADLPLAHGDSGRITQCLMNLAGNSLKFTKQGSVGISVALENGTLTWKVQDTGIGIPADKIGSLFTEFKQTDATIASEYGGTGLGLSISKKFVEMHGGRIWAESEVGRGSKFIFEVPLRAAEKGAE